MSIHVFMLDIGMATSVISISLRGIYFEEWGRRENYDMNEAGHQCFIDIVSTNFHICKVGFSNIVTNRVTVQ